jgi:hypothetical protein
MTYGAELAGEQTMETESYLTTEQNEYRKAHSWPGVVGRLAGLEVINGGRGGSSNERILRSTINDVVRLKLGPDDFVIIGWTEHERLEYVQDNKWVQQTVRVRPRSYREKRFIDDWARLNLSSTTRCWEKFFVHALSLQAFLDARSIPWLMFNALPVLTINDFPKVPLALVHLRNELNKERWITPIDDLHKCMFNQVKDFPTGPERHPLAEGHQRWGEIVYAKFCELSGSMVSRSAQTLFGAQTTQASYG